MVEECLLGEGREKLFAEMRIIQLHPHQTDGDHLLVLSEHLDGLQSRRCQIVPQRGSSLIDHPSSGCVLQPFRKLARAHKV